MDFTHQTVAFPVHGTLMVEPTESEPFGELNRLVEAMVAIKARIDELQKAKQIKTVNVIMKAPHTAQMVKSDEWNLPYSVRKLIPDALVR